MTNLCNSYLKSDYNKYVCESCLKKLWSNLQNTFNLERGPELENTMGKILRLKMFFFTIFSCIRCCGSSVEIELGVLLAIVIDLHWTGFYIFDFWRCCIKWTVAHFKRRRVHTLCTSSTSNGIQDTLLSYAGSGYDTNSRCNGNGFYLIVCTVFFAISCGFINCSVSKRFLWKRNCSTSWQILI